jgi:hypothetical protein
MYAMVTHLSGTISHYGGDFLANEQSHEYHLLI